jgi:hypothetical protein
MADDKKRPRLKAPRSQAPREDVRARSPQIVLAQNPAELLYQAYAKALDYKGPNGVPLKLWHELAAKERRALGAAFEEWRLLMSGGAWYPTPNPGPDAVTVTAARPGVWASVFLPVAMLQDEPMLPMAIGNTLEVLREKMDELEADVSDD